MDRMLVAFETPVGVEAETYEELWDGWVGRLHSLGLRLVADLDPVDTYSVSLGADMACTVELYEVAAL